MELVVQHRGIMANQLSYNTLNRANAFFTDRLFNNWFDFSDEIRQKALNSAKDFIDRLAYKGTKADPNQTNQWPRNLNSNVCIIDINLLNVMPDGIYIAECLIANMLLDGFDFETEIQNTRVTSRGFSSVRTTYDPTLAFEYLVAGIPSAQAWSYLSPYLSDSRSIRLSRVS